MKRQHLFMLAAGATIGMLFLPGTPTRAEIVSVAPRLEIWTAGGQFWGKPGSEMVINVYGGANYKVISGCPIRCVLVLRGAIRQDGILEMRNGTLSVRFKIPNDARPGDPAVFQFRVTEASIPNVSTVFRTLIIQN